MEEISNLLKKLSVEDVEKLKLLMSLTPKAAVDKGEATVKEKITIQMFAKEYGDLIKQNRSEAYYTSVNISFKYLTNYFGSLRLIQSIGLKDIESFISHLQHKAAKGYRVYVRTLKAAFNKAVDWCYLRDNYFLKVKLPKKQQVNPAYIDKRQLNLICEQIHAQIIKDFIVSGFFTGMRLNELVNLKWKNINLTTRIITVGDEEFKTKGRNQRYIPICDEVYDILLSKICKRRKILRLKNDFVFCKENSEPYTGDYFSKNFKRACKNAAIDESIHFHSLRHSFASNLAQNGIPLYTIKELLGHSSISTTEIYSHLNVETLRDAISVLDDNIPDRTKREKKTENNKGNSQLRIIVNKKNEG